MEMKRNFDCTPLESASRETHRGDRGQEAVEPARHSDAVCQQVRFFAPREQTRRAGGLDWMVRIAERMLRKWPKAITFVCPPPWFRARHFGRGCGLPALRRDGLIIVGGTSLRGVLPKCGRTSCLRVATLSRSSSSAPLLWTPRARRALSRPPTQCQLFASFPTLFLLCTIKSPGAQHFTVFSPLL